MPKFEHVFEVRASLDKDGKVVLRIGKDEGVVIARNVKTGYGNIREYDFEIGSCEFEDDTKMLRKSRREIKEFLKGYLEKAKKKIDV